MMDEASEFPHSAEHDRAIEFTGNWKEYLPIAVSNALLTVVTLGIYRFWAAARQRRYLWSHTRVIDDTLEWTGTGKEMFVGFLIVTAVLLPFFLFIQFAFPALISRGKEAAAGGLFILFYLAILYLSGFALFRALRYRLSRTWWHGIRGGSDEPGWNYGGEYLGRTLATFMSGGIAHPWMAVALWNSRWNSMSFGQTGFEAALDVDGLKRRWFALYAMFFGLILLMLLFFGVSAFMAEAAGTLPGTVVGVVALLFIIFYLAIPLVIMSFYAKFYRKAADSLRLGDIQFGFTASTWGWIKLFLGNIALAIVTLGFGLTYWGYRNWAFIVRHLELYGEIDLAALTQSTTRTPGEAEGFADAFDIGAI